MGKISFSEQFYALFQKNTLEDRRSKMYAKESIIPVILFILYMYSGIYYYTRISSKN